MAKVKIWPGEGSGLPTVYIHSVAGTGENVWRRCREYDSVLRFNLVSIYDFDFEGDMTPWPAAGVRRGAPEFRGGAVDYLKVLTEDIMPEAEASLPSGSGYNAVAGYSLAGLFALWTAWNTDAFRRIACGSASFWYPGFTEYIIRRAMVSRPEFVYLSLGDNESNTRHPVMSRVGNCTDRVLRYLDGESVPHLFEVNPGNHFSDPDGRLAKAIIKMLRYEE